MLLEIAMPNIRGHLDTFIIELICDSTREKLDINVIFQKVKNIKKRKK